MVQPFSEQEELRYKEVFSLFDTEGDGVVTGKDLGMMIRALGKNPTESQLANMINDVDIDGNGTIDYKEFLNMMTRSFPKSDDEDSLNEAFATFDINQTGLIHITELTSILTNLGEPLFQEELDETAKLLPSFVDGNGMVNYRDFTKILLSNVNRTIC